MSTDEKAPIANALSAILGGDAQFEAIISGAWEEPAASLARALGIADDRIVVGGNDAFPLIGKGRCWLLLHGSVDLFLADADGRAFVARVRAGGILDAFTERDGPERMLAVPTDDTELVETTRGALHACAAAGRDGGGFGRIWRLWHDALTPEAGAVRPAAPEPVAKAASGEPGRRPGWEETVDALNRAVFERAAASRRQASAARKARLAQANDATAREFAARLSGMANALRHTGSAERSGTPFTLMDAARTVFSALLLDREPIEPQGGDALAETEALQLFAQENDLQLRSVRLEDGWWHADHGPLLAFVGPERRPCALLRATRDGYWLVTGAGRQRVGTALAARVDPIAYSFAPGLPKETITPWRLFRYGIGGGGGDIRNILICILIAGLLSLVTPLAMGWLMNPIIPSADRNQVYVIGLILLAAGLCGAVNTTIQSFAMVRLEGAMDNRIQSAVWIRILNLPSAFFRNYIAGDLANRADSVDSMRQVLGQSLNLFLISAVSAIFSFGLMLWYDWRVSLLVLLACAAFGIITYAVGRQVLSYNRQTLDVGGRAQGLTLQMISAIAKLRVAGAERRAFLEWLVLYRRNIDLGLRQGMLSNRLRVFRAMFEYLIPLLVLGVIGYQMGILFTWFHFDDADTGVATPILNTGQFVSFNAALGQFLGSAFSFTRGNLSLAMTAPLYARVSPILLAQEEERIGHGRLSAIKGDIAFRNVSFRYEPEQPLALKELSFTAARGDFTAIVGPSGAGKSSIVRLLLGFEEPESGAVLVDGNDVRFLDRRDLRRQYGVVLQDGSLLTGSVFDNVAAGLPFTTGEVMEALRIADLDEAVASWPMGLGTLVGNSSSTISRGQRQRLMIARAVIRKPQVLILDEATSALDNVAQARVTANLRALGRTQIVIAHRLSTIIAADKIVVVDAGTVVESGTYTELMARDGLFARLARRQME